MGSPLVPVALGVAVVGTIGVNIGSWILQRTHKQRAYCTLPLEVLEKNERGVKLLGGMPIRIKKIDLSKAELNTKLAKLSLPVKGNTRLGIIHTMSTRSSVDEEWELDYAVMTVKQGKYKWNLWLHPADELESNTSLLPNDVQEILEKFKQSDAETQRNDSKQQPCDLKTKQIKNGNLSDVTQNKLLENKSESLENGGKIEQVEKNENIKKTEQIQCGPNINNNEFKSNIL